MSWGGNDERPKVVFRKPSGGGSEASSVFIIVGAVAAIVIAIGVLGFLAGVFRFEITTTELATTRTERDELIATVSLTLDQCSPNDSEAGGTVGNNGVYLVDIFIEVDFENAAGVIVYQSNDWVRSLAPGRTARWQSSGFEPFKECSARVRSVFDAR